MKISIQMEINPFRQVLIRLNTQKDDIQLQLDNQSGWLKPDSAKMVELEVLMRPA